MYVLTTLDEFMHSYIPRNEVAMGTCIMFFNRCIKFSGTL